MQTKIIKIYSENNYFQHAEVLKRNRVKRFQNQEFFVEGVKGINLALENKWEITAFLYAFDKKLSDWAEGILAQHIANEHISMPSALMEKLSEKEETSELLAIVKMRDPGLESVKLKKDLLVVVLDRISSPGNLGTILRSCSSFKVDAVVMTGHSVDLYDPKTIQASVGTIFSLPVIRLASPQELLSWIKKIKIKFKNFEIIGTTVKTDLLITKTQMKRPLMLLIGNETMGLSNNYKALSDKLLKIPISGAASSLNVACATAICLYEINR